MEHRGTKFRDARRSPRLATGVRPLLEYTVLHVENNRGITEEVREVLGRLGARRVDTACTEGQALMFVDRQRPQLIVLECGMVLGSRVNPAESTTIRRLSRAPLVVYSAVLSGHDGERRRQEFEAIGIPAVAKTGGKAALRLACRRAVCSDGPLREVGMPHQQEEAWEPTKAERRVLDLLVLGVTNKEIAGALGCSAKTIEFHISRMLRKLSVETRTGLVGRWLTHGR